eukprot:scaffold78211_cov63-Phaeocystis_antarctica.AAC.1
MFERRKHHDMSTCCVPARRTLKLQYGAQSIVIGGHWPSFRSFSGHLALRGATRPLAEHADLYRRHATRHHAIIPHPLVRVAHMRVRAAIERVPRLRRPQRRPDIKVVAHDVGQHAVLEAARPLRETRRARRDRAPIPKVLSAVKVEVTDCLARLGALFNDSRCTVATATLPSVNGGVQVATRSDRPMWDGRATSRKVARSDQRTNRRQP